MRQAVLILLFATALVALTGQARAASGCTASLRTELDMQSFQDTGIPNRRPTAAQLEALRMQADARFRAVADRMCASGALRPAALRPFRRLLVQEAAGADNAAFMSGGEEVGGRGTLVFQYVFDGGGDTIDYRVPDEEDLREGLICWLDFAGNQEMCELRLP